ncbi:MAG: hypothetical protein DMF58_02310, partial [Acidobacteria bacterium]
MGGGAGRHLILRICAAVWGIAIAIAAAPLISRPAPPGQIPGPATTFGIDARAPFWFIALLVAIPLLMPWITSALLRPLLEAGTRRWARNCAAISMLVPIWFVTITQDILWVIVPAALVLIVCIASRRLRADFSLHDAILLPTVLTTFFALIDLLPVGIDKLLILATAIVLTVRLLIVLIHREALPASCFAL